MIDTPVSSPTLGDLIREAAADMPSDATPPQIAERVIALAGSELAHQFLLELVTATVYTRIAQSRNNSMNTAPPRSAKQARVRDWWAKFLSSRVSIGEFQWKTMGTCTVEDLQHCIEDRQRSIIALQAKIVTYETIIEAMKKNNAATVGDLTPDQVSL